MLQFIKGGNLSSYNALLEATSSYNDSFFLDTTNTRLYYAGKPLDIRVTEINKIGEDFIPTKSYQFVNSEGTTSIIADALIPELDETKFVLHDTETMKDTEYRNGLMGIKDKYIVEAIAKLLGISIEYTYYANVLHVEDKDNLRFDVKRDVIVTQDESGQWTYSYEAYEHPYYTQDINGNYVYNGILKKPAGTAPVDESDVRVQSMDIVRTISDENLWDSGKLKDDQKMLNNHGNIPAGTTVSELKKKTVSEILGDILFENAKPVKVNDNTAYIKFKDEKYGKYVEVGTPYPYFDDFETIFIPETWQWKSIANPSTVGEPQPLTRYVSTKYYLHDYEHPWHPGHGPSDPNWDIYDVEGVGYGEHCAEYTIVEGDKCVYTGVITYEYLANAKDSNGEETYVVDGETYYYAKGTDGSINSANELRFTGSQNIPDSSSFEIEFNITTGWKIYSNASNVSTGSLWSVKNEEPGEYVGVDEIRNSNIFAIDKESVYLQWPSATTEAEKFYVYIPEAYEISSIAGAHDIINDNWTAIMNASIVDEDVIITNGNGIDGKYHKYNISKSSGITTAKIDIVKMPAE